ncbi:myo-inositol-1(or 4)-monophosphatase [Rhodoligotrophos appendicifer]|uniref:histidinol-phosphatase n=1 Tax=Rhodoligotrophos appendicifer TaxID=987056 RepID=UPI001184EB90|nr:histidinol-phosphatase [Rhodoligotrophos appendicifer]
MTKDQPHAAELLAFARHLGDAAAAITLPLFRAPLVIDNKGGDLFDPVTEADREAEQAIRSLIAAEYPTHGVVGEEFGLSTGTSPYTWVIDPIDGTRAFVCGMPTWTTLVGLLKDGEPYLGLMQQPFVGERFFASPNGAFLDNIRGCLPLKTRPAETLRSATMATTSPEIFKTSWEVERLALMRRQTRTIRYGTDAYAYCLLAAGHIDLVVEASLAPYDVVALIPIVQQAGGVMTDWSGGAAKDGGNIIAAASPALHEAALAVLNS